MWLLERFTYFWMHGCYPVNSGDHLQRNSSAKFCSSFHVWLSDWSSHTEVRGKMMRDPWVGVVSCTKNIVRWICSAFSRLYDSTVKGKFCFPWTSLKFHNLPFYLGSTYGLEVSFLGNYLNFKTFFTVKDLLSIC